MEYLIGFGLALAAALFARFTGLDRDRAFYPTVMIVIALTYGLFAAMAGSLSVLALESVAIVGFIAVSVLGFKFSQWIIVAALAGHGIYDFFHPHVLNNPGVPVWWPGFCLTYDVTAAGYLAWLLQRRQTAAAS